MCWMLSMRTRKRPCSWKCARSRCGAGKSGRRNWRGKWATLSAREQSQKQVTMTTHHRQHLTFMLTFLRPVYIARQGAASSFSSALTVTLLNKAFDRKPSVSGSYLSVKVFAQSAVVYLVQGYKRVRCAFPTSCAAGCAVPSVAHVPIISTNSCLPRQEQCISKNLLASLKFPKTTNLR